MQKKVALIIFAKPPEKGKVKTRLAASVGEDAALAVYKALLKHTHAITCNLSCDKYVFYAGHIPNSDDWEGYEKELQQGASIGERMRNAFARIFQQGYKRIVLIGSDCFELTEEVLEQAFFLFEENELVIGPALDGGYYLIGMKDGLKDVFNGVEWSTDKVWKQTKEHLLANRYSYGLLPVLTDVDTVQDLPGEYLLQLQVRQ